MKINIKNNACSPSFGLKSQTHRRLNAEILENAPVFKDEELKDCLRGTSLVGVVHGVRVAPSLAFYGSDPLHLLQVPMLYSQYRTCLLHLFNELPGSVDYMKFFVLCPKT